MKYNDGAEFFLGTGPCTASFLEVGDQAIQSVILAEKEDLVLAMEIIVEVRGRKIGGCGDFAHASVRETAGAEFAASGAEDLHAAGEVTTAEAG